MDRPRHKNLGTLLSAASLLALLTGCYGQGRLASADSEEILSINKEYVVDGNEGKKPVTIDSNSNLARYAMKSNGKINSYVLIIYPFDVKGTLKIESDEDFVRKKEITEEDSLYGDYLDKLLRAHRMLLQGQVDASERMIAGIETRFEAGYGTDILRGSISMLRGNAADGFKYYGRAKALVPEYGDNQFLNLSKNVSKE